MKSQRQVSVSIIIPCLNEEKAVGQCVKKALLNTYYLIPDTRDNFRSKKQELRIKQRIETEVIVVDNGSTDRSAERARKAGAKVIFEPKKGYGRALLAGLNRATGDYLIFADGDGSYDFREVPRLLEKLTGNYYIENNIKSRSQIFFFGQEITRNNKNCSFDNGFFRGQNPSPPAGGSGCDSSKTSQNYNSYDLVIGSRLRGKIEKGAMPFLHRYFGTPIINFLFRIFFKQKVSDVNSGFRGMTKKAFGKLRLYSTGMEFASEMLSKAVRKNLTIGEVPISYKRRIGKSKLSSFRDAWRHLKFMLLFSPSYLFVWPGMIIGGLGLLGLLGLLAGRIILFGRYFDMHTMIVSAFMVLLGFQIVFLGLFAKVFAVNFLEEKDEKTTGIMDKITLEKGVAFGCFLLAVGCLLFAYVFVNWWAGGFGALNMERFLIFGMTILVLGVEIIFSSFFFGLLGREER